MDKKFQFHIKKACVNRNVVINKVGEDFMILDNNKFYTIREIEDYLETKERCVIKF